jgi:hypothetical protein
MSNTPWPFESVLTNKRTSEPPGEHGPLERIYGHELVTLPYLFGNTRVPVLDPDENTFAVIVPRVADV